MSFQFVFRRRYSMAHRLTSGAAPKCGVPHGHDEMVTVEIAPSGPGQLDPATNMLAEFGAVKARWFRWIDDQVDHSFHLNGADHLIGFFREHEPAVLPRLLITPGDPTTEIKAACFLSKLNAFLAAQDLPLIGVKVTIDETPTNAVIFDGDPTAVLPAGDFWWQRADDSMSDLKVDGSV